MAPYANLHLAFEQMRIKAKNHESDNRNQPAPEPPRVMIIGPEDSGKTTASKIIVNYAVKAPRLCTPVLVNLDPAEGGWTVPGTLSAAVISSPIPTQSPVNPFGGTATSAPTALSSSALLPIVYWYGHAEPKRNQPMYEKTMQNLATALKQRIATDDIVYQSGICVDTPSSFAVASRVGTEMRYPLVEMSVELFQINVIVVIGHEKLNVEMQRLFNGEAKGYSRRHVTVVKVAKSGGVVDLDYAYRSRLLSLQIRTYFYGQSMHIPEWLDVSKLGGEASLDLVLSPYSSNLKFGDIKIFRIGAESMAPSSALPIGASRVITELEPTQVNPQEDGLLNALLALIPQPPNNPNAKEVVLSDEELLASDVTGFILVTSIDIAKQKFTLLSPGAGTLIGRTAIIGSYEGQDH